MDDTLTYMAVHTGASYTAVHRYFIQLIPVSPSVIDTTTEKLYHYHSRQRSSVLFQTYDYLNKHRKTSIIDQETVPAMLGRTTLPLHYS